MAKIGNLTAKDLGCKAGHWEKLTQGQCNNTLVEVKQKPLTIRQIKDAAMRGEHVKRATRKFEKAEQLVGKDLRKLSDAWFNRTPGNTTGFFDQKKARDARCGMNHMPKVKALIRFAEQQA